MYTQQAADNRHDDAYVFSGHHDVIFACFGARGMVCADVMFNAPLAWILAVRTFCTPKHTHTHHSVPNVQCKYLFCTVSRQYIKISNLYEFLPTPFNTE